MTDEIRIKTIGSVSSPVAERVDKKWGEVISRVNLKSEYRGSLAGLENFSHAIIVTYLHQAKYVPSKHLKRRPKGLESMPEVGIFSQRVKDRPNPIGITAVKIIGVGDDYLEVRGLDAIDATPVIDIKPYYPHFDRIEAPSTPEWVDHLMEDYF